MNSISPNIFAFFPLVIFPIVGILFFVLLKRKNTRSQRELEQKLIYETTCSGQIGAMNYRGPFIRLSLYDEFIVLSGLKLLEINLSQIEKVVIPNSQLRRTRIIHRQSETPTKIYLSDKSNRLESALKEVGVSVVRE